VTGKITPLALPKPVAMGVTTPVSRLRTPTIPAVSDALGFSIAPEPNDATVHAQDRAQGHLSYRGAWGDPKHRGAIRPKPQCKLSPMSQLLTIYTNPRLQAISYAIMLARLAYDGN
jgi:hypothetical protein